MLRYRLIKFPRFDSVIGDCTNKAAALKKLAESNRVDPRSIVYVGDTRGDMMAAKEAGVIGVGITSGYHAEATVRQGGPDFVFKNVIEFINSFIDHRKS